MTGQDLYELWCSKLAAQRERHQYAGLAPTAWQFLEYPVRTAWSDTAGSLAPRERQGDE